MRTEGYSEELLDFYYDNLTMEEILIYIGKGLLPISDVFLKYPDFISKIEDFYVYDGFQLIFTQPETSLGIIDINELLRLDRFSTYLKKSTKFFEDISTYPYLNMDNIFDCITYLQQETTSISTINKRLNMLLTNIFQFNRVITIQDLLRFKEIFLLGLKKSTKHEIFRYISLDEMKKCTEKELTEFLKYYFNNISLEYNLSEVLNLNTILKLMSMGYFNNILTYIFNGKLRLSEKDLSIVFEEYYYITKEDNLYHLLNIYDISSNISQEKSEFCLLEYYSEEFIKTYPQIFKNIVCLNNTNLYNEDLVKYLIEKGESQ